MPGGLAPKTPRVISHGCSIAAHGAGYLLFALSLASPAHVAAYALHTLQLGWWLHFSDVAPRAAAGVALLCNMLVMQPVAETASGVSSGLLTSPQAGGSSWPAVPPAPR